MHILVKNSRLTSRIMMTVALHCRVCCIGLVDSHAVEQPERERDDERQHEDGGPRDGQTRHRGPRRPNEQRPRPAGQNQQLKPDGDQHAFAVWATDVQPPAVDADTRQHEHGDRRQERGDPDHAGKDGASVAGASEPDAVLDVSTLVDVFERIVELARGSRQDRRRFAPLTSAVVRVGRRRRQTVPHATRPRRHGPVVAIRLRVGLVRTAKALLLRGSRAAAGVAAMAVRTVMTVAVQSLRWLATSRPHRLGLHGSADPNNMTLCKNNTQRKLQSYRTQFL